MTFTEAAAHVLRLVGKPLHYKEITDVAIEKDLLSHVGKSPEVTMGARLAAVVKKDPKDNPLVRVKPGIFALRDWDSATVEAGLSDRTPALERLAQLEATNPEVLAVPPPLPMADVAAESDDELDVDVFAYDPGELEEAAIGADERARAQLAAAASDLFVEEEDDDEPILGAEAEEETREDAEAEGEGDGDAAGRRRRRRRRRGGRGATLEDEGLPSYTVSEAPLPLDTEVRLDDAEGGDASKRQGGRRVDGRGESREARGEGRESREARGEGRESREVRGEGRESREARGEGREPREARGEGRESRESRGAEGRASEARGEGRPESRALEGRLDATPAAGAEERLPAPSELINAAKEAVAAAGRQATVPLRQVAEPLARRLRQDPAIVADAIGDALRAETLTARVEGRLPALRLTAKGVAQSEWGAEGELARAEREIQVQLEKYQEHFQRSFSRRLQSLPPRGLGDLFRLMLGQLGYEDIQSVRRPGSASQELHFCAVARGMGADVPTAIVLRRDGREVGRERVIELRGTLHHYGEGVLAGMIVTTGQVLSGAREEARAAGAAPVKLMDGVALARACARSGVGVTHTVLRLPCFDAELLDTLKSV